MAVAAFSTVVEWYDFTLYLYLATVLLVYQSSKALTEEMAGVALEAIVRQQAAEIAGYFNGVLHPARISADLLARELSEGQLSDSRIADQPCNFEGEMGG